MMGSYPFRPTPIVTLAGKTVGTDGVRLREKAGTMHGYAAAADYKALNDIGRRTMRGNPWLVGSGTMGRFLGDDSGDFGAPFDTSSAPIDDTLQMPVFNDPIIPINLGPVTPIDTTSISSGGSLIMPTIAPVSNNQQDIANLAAGIGTGSGSGIPAPPASAISSIINSITGIFKPKTTVLPMTAAQPGVYSPYATTSWFGQTGGVIAGMPNSSALLLGAGGLLAILAVTSAMGGKKR